MLKELPSGRGTYGNCERPGDNCKKLLTGYHDPLIISDANPSICWGKNMLIQLPHISAMISRDPW